MNRTFTPGCRYAVGGATYDVIVLGRYDDVISLDYAGGVTARVMRRVQTDGQGNEFVYLGAQRTVMA